LIEDHARAASVLFVEVKALGRNFIRGTLRVLSKPTGVFVRSPKLHEKRISEVIMFSEVNAFEVCLEFEKKQRLKKRYCE